MLEIAALVGAVGTALTGLAAVISALRHRKDSQPR